jgi:PPOX class probable F420-dependent enzyme
MTITIPDSHRNLLLKPIHAVLTTMMPDEQPQSSIIWADYDDEYVLFSTTLERQKGRNMQTNPKVTLLVIDPKNGSRWIEVRGVVVEMTQDGVEVFADRLTRLYTDNHKQRFYRDMYPIEQQQKETRVLVKIEPVKIALDAIFKE